MSAVRSPTPRWDLDALGPGLSSPEFTRAEETTTARLARLTARFDDLGVGQGAALPADEKLATVAVEVIESLAAAMAEVRELRALAYARVAQDGTDDAAGATQDRLRRTLTVPLNTLTTRFDAWIGRTEPDELAAHHPVISDHLHPLRRSKEAARYQMTEPEETLAAELGLTGSAAWVRLHGDICARLTGRPEGGPDDGTELPMTVLRGRATDPDPSRREAAFTAEIDAWESVSVPLAAALNSQKGETQLLNRRRGWADDLSPALFENGIDHMMLEAMNAEVVDALGDFHRFFASKASLLGHDHALPWWDLIAPVRPPADAFTWNDALDRVMTAFDGYGRPLADLATRAAEEQWIDAEPRAGKAGGAFCMPVRDDVSRILLSYDGSADSIQTLAHELGHAYHNTNLGQRSWLQRQTPRCLAETASIFCETLVVESLLADPAADRLSVLDTDLSGAAQVVVDIHSRFRFETALYERRAGGTLSVDELCELMTECQEHAYGSAVAPLHPYMWAVKAHYFTPYYNFPYTFGLLFGLGLFARYRSDPERFRGGYDTLLSNTGTAPADELAAEFGIDLSDRAFWNASLDVLRERIDEYCRLASNAQLT